MKKWLKEHSLSSVMLSLFLIFLVGHSLTGVRHYNEEQQDHSQPTLSYVEYLRSGDFVESIFENWESEFLQMCLYVVLTAFLFRKGSAESKKLRGQDQDAIPKKSNSQNAPWPVRRGGWVLHLYKYSLGLAFALLFIMSFSLHAYGGARATCEENLAHGGDCPSIIEYASSSKFWFESFQNWQSEFMVMYVMITLSIFLRQQGSPESKKVSAPHSETGS